MNGETQQDLTIKATGSMAVAACASVGAGAVHAAAIGVHSDHPRAVLAFVAVAAFQIGWGALALRSSSRPLAAIGVAGQLACLGGWVLAKTIGISFVAGLDQVEKVQFADGLAAALAAVSVMACLLVIVLPVPRAVRRTSRFVAALPAVVVAVLTVPAMASAGRHVHAGTVAAGHDHAATAAASAADSSTATSPAHVHTDTTDAIAVHLHTDSTVDPTASPTTAAVNPAGGAVTPTTVHQHEPDPTLPAASNWPRPWDPAQPLDLSGVAGVSPEQIQRATKLVEGTLADLPRYADTKAAIADGYVSIGDAGTGTEHYIKASLIEDSDMLDPLAPESLVYDVNGNQRTLAGAMYIASTRPVGDPSLTAFAGPLMQWHIHDNLCWDRVGGKSVVVGIVDANGNCARGVRAGGGNPMVHVWIVPRACGVFSALEGIGAGSAAVPNDQRVDVCAHSH